MRLKKILSLFILFIFGLTLIGCSEDPKEQVKGELEKILKGVVVGSEINGLLDDYILPDEVNDEYLITWTIDEKYKSYAYIETNELGIQKIKVTRPDVDSDWAEFVFEATIRKGSVTASRQWKGYVKPKEETVALKCADVFDIKQGKNVTVSGTVVYVNGIDGYWLADETGRVYVYLNGEHDIKVGEEITVSGTKELYFSTLEIKDTTIESRKDGTYNYEEDTKESTVDEIFDIQANSKEGGKYTKDAISNLGKFYKISGMIVDNPVSGTNYKYAIKDNLSGKYAVLYGSAFQEGTEEKLVELKGKYAEMIVLYQDFYSTGFARVIPMVETIEETAAPVISDSTKVANTKANLEKLLSDNITSDINLPLSNEFEGLTIEWSSSNEAVLDKTGKVGTSVNAKEEVILTAIIKVGELTETVEYKVNVLFLAESTISEVTALCDGESKKVLFTGKIVAIDQNSYFYVADSTGVIYVRKELKEAAVGDVVEIIGETSAYLSEGKQYTRQINATSITKVEKEIEVKKALKVEIDDFDAINQIDGIITDDSIASIKKNSLYGQIVQITGYVVLKGEYSNAYIASENNETSASLLVYYKSENYDTLKSFAGKLVTIECPVYDAHGKDGWRLGTPISITEGEVVTNYNKISDVQNMENDKDVLVKGTVTYVYSSGVYVADETASIYVYTKSAPEVKLGDVVEVSGKKGNYNGPQIASPVITVIESGEFTYVTEAKTMEEIAALTDELSLFGKVFETEFVVIKTQKDDKVYYNAGYGTEDENLQLYNTDSIVSQLETLEGKTISCKVMLYAYYKGWRMFIIPGTIVEK